MSFLFFLLFLPPSLVPFLLAFFLPDRRPPSTPSFLIHSSFFTSFTPPPPPSPLHGSHFPFRSPLFPPIILFPLLSSLFSTPSCHSFSPVLLAIPAHFSPNNNNNKKRKWVLLLLSYTLPSIQSTSLLPSFSFLPPPFSPLLAPSFCIPPPNSALFSPRHGSHYSFRSPLCPSNHPPPSPRLHPCLSPSSSSPSPALPSPLNWGCVTSFIFCDIPLSACYTLSFPSARRLLA